MDYHSQMPFLVLIVGVVTGMSGLLRLVDLRSKGFWVKGLFCGSIFLPMLMQVIQYSYVTDQKKREREAAIALYAFGQYTQNPSQTSGSRDERLLELASNGDPDIDPDYFLGYASFRTQQYDLARRYFQAAIDKKRFRAQSEYLLGTMERKSQEASPHPDYSKALDYMDRAIHDDKDYMGSYYGRAILYERGGRFDDAMMDLEKSANTLAEACYDLNDEKEVEVLWKALAAARPSQFNAIKTKCMQNF